MASRIYVVEDTVNETVALVRANGGVSAINFIANGQYEAHKASAEEVAQYMAAGAVIQDATGDGTPDNPAAS